MYNIANFFHNLLSDVLDVASINAMDLKNLPNINMLLKVDQFERFSNQSNAN